LWWVDLFVLRDHEESRNTDELHLLLADLVEAAVPVDDVDSEEERLRPQLEVVVDLDEPVDERGPDRLINFLLLQHVRWVGVPFLLYFEHVLVDVLAKLGHVVHVAKSGPVDALDLTEDLVLAPLIEHLEFLVQADARELLPRGRAQRLLRPRQSWPVQVRLRQVLLVGIHFAGVWCNATNRTDASPKTTRHIWPSR